MLARFVCPASRLSELEQQLGDAQPPAVSAVLDGGGLGDVRPPGGGGRDRRPAASSSRPASTCSARSRSTATGATCSPPSPPRAARAKLRCGGKYVPTVEEVAAFFAAARELELPFKATAGLHHPGALGARARLPQLPHGRRPRGGGRATRRELRASLASTRRERRSATRLRRGAASCSSRSARARSPSRSRTSRRWGSCDPPARRLLAARRRAARRRPRRRPRARPRRRRPGRARRSRASTR